MGEQRQRTIRPRADEREILGEEKKEVGGCEMKPETEAEAGRGK
jgi:hypothetical protein